METKSNKIAVEDYRRRRAKKRIPDGEMMPRKSKRNKKTESSSAADERNQDEQLEAESSSRRTREPSDHRLKSAVVKLIRCPEPPEPDDVLEINPNADEHISIEDASDSSDDLRSRINVLQGAESLAVMNSETRAEKRDDIAVTIENPEAKWQLPRPTELTAQTGAIRKRPSTEEMSHDDIAVTSANHISYAEWPDEPMPISKVHGLMDWWEDKLHEAKAMGKLPFKPLMYTPTFGGRAQMCMDSMDRILGNTLSPNFEHFQLANLAVMLENLKEYWQTFKEESMAAYGSLPPGDARNLHAKAESLYTNAASALTNRIATLTVRPQPPPSANADDSRDQSMDGVRLRKVDAPQFDGEYANWPAFKSFFEQYYMRNNVNNVVRMYMLREYIKPNTTAAGIVNSIDLGGENFEQAWNALKQTYDDDRKILEAHVIAFLDMPKLSESPTRKAMTDMVTQTRTLINSMPKFGVDTTHWGILLVPMLVRKLDRLTCSEWAMKRPPRRKPELEPLLEFIQIRSEGIDLAYTGNNSATNAQHQQPNRYTNGRYNNNSRTEDASRNNNASRNANAEQPDSNRANDRRCPDPACVYPQNQHRLYKCFRFTALELEGRKRKATALGVCKRCLRKKCLEGKCKTGPCPECGEEHNLWLCSKKNMPPHTHTPQSNAHASLQNAGAMVMVPPPANDGGALLATAIIRIKDANGALIEFRALLDSGSHVSMITTSAHQRLRLDKPTPALSFNGIGGNKAMSLGTVNVEYHSRFDTDRIFYMTTYVIKKITSKLPPQQFEVNSWTHLDGLQLADPGYNIPGEIDVLIGAPALSDIVRQGMRRGGRDEPVGQYTKTGWIVFGKTQVTPTRLEAFHTIKELPEIDEEPSLDHMLTRLWEMEKVAERHVRTAEEKICEYHFKQHTTQDDDGRYIVRISIRSTDCELGESRSIALRRWLQMEQRFIKYPELKKSYNDFMEEYLALGHMKKCAPLHQGEVGCYIPHHAAGTEKFRVVFDGSCRTANGRSLNDIQLTGEKLQPDLTTTTMRFRTHKFALCADIKKMYRQIKVPDDQMTYQRILWRRDVNHPIYEYNLTTQTYGLRSAPHNCVRALKQCAIDNKSKFPEAAVIAQRDFYIDDLITGGDSEEEIIEIYKSMTEMLSKGCFELAKWSTNSWHVNDVINTADVYAPVHLDRVSEIENSVLGLIWLSAGDIFRYKIAEPSQDPKLTMRKITSYAAQLYDPNGYLSAVTVVAKSIIQKMWIAKCTWDGKVPEPIVDEWKEFLEELPAISDVEIPRWIGTSKGTAAELHGFCDASKLAYGCAFYVKTTDDDGNIRVSLVAARTRVAPIKRTTIPRMELCGAHLMAKLLKEVRLAHDIEENNCHLWTDSMIVLHWLENTPANSKVFIANRVSETDELTNGCTWRHVRTDDNPADAASRGIPASKLVGNSLWWHGPEWLKSPSTEWPTTKVVL